MDCWECWQSKCPTDLLLSQLSNTINSQVWWRINHWCYMVLFSFPVSNLCHQTLSDWFKSKFSRFFPKLILSHSLSFTIREKENQDLVGGVWAQLSRHNDSYVASIWLEKILAFDCQEYGVSRVESSPGAFAGPGDCGQEATWCLACCVSEGQVELQSPGFYADMKAEIQIQLIGTVIAKLWKHWIKKSVQESQWDSYLLVY